MKEKLTFKATDQLKVGTTFVYDPVECVTKGETSSLNLGLNAEFKL